MNEKRQAGVSGKGHRSVRPTRPRKLYLVGSAALVQACSNFVVQLDAHRVGAAIFLGVIALAAVTMVFVAMTLRTGKPLTAHRLSD
ncbi:hypothetical protein [Paraburkholderia sp. BL10I2N1]|uniref:hypothetical protein n=1 Tax=Paraburkholderia sp. BL10I2N1 TaxID=1938796 RepID=UPI001061C766|nr:hypothetical protein [Paraburkholderia sp. BL10I2N1]